MGRHWCIAAAASTVSDFGVAPSIVNRGYANIVRSTLARSAPDAPDPLLFSDGGSATALQGVTFGDAAGPLLGRPRGVDGAAEGNVFYADNAELQANVTDRAAPPARQFRLLPEGGSLPVAPLDAMPPQVRLRMLSRDDQFFTITSKVRSPPNPCAVLHRAVLCCCVCGSGCGDSAAGGDQPRCCSWPWSAWCAVVLTVAASLLSAVSHESLGHGRPGVWVPEWASVVFFCWSVFAVSVAAVGSADLLELWL